MKCLSFKIHLIKKFTSLYYLIKLVPKHFPPLPFFSNQLTAKTKKIECQGEICANSKDLSMLEKISFISSKSSTTAYSNIDLNNSVRFKMSGRNPSKTSTKEKSRDKLDQISIGKTEVTN